MEVGKGGELAVPAVERHRRQFVAHRHRQPPEHKLHHRERQGRELLLVGSGTCGTKEGGI
jgi:hypothetical protein